MNSFLLIPFGILALAVRSMEGKAFYENITPDGAHHVQPFEKDYYVSWLDMEVDTNLVVAVTAFLITLALLAINSVYPLSNIQLPMLDGSSRGSRHLAVENIPENLDHLNAKIASPSRPAYLDSAS